MKTNTIIYLLLFTMISFKSMVGQITQKEPDFYNWFDDKVNRFNTGLFNGLEYIEQYRTINNRYKFFKSSEFQTGSIVYDGQFYDKVLLKYDLNTDELLFNVGYNYPYPTLILFKSKVKSFKLGESDFVHIAMGEGNNQMSGFYELLLVGDPITLLKKNKKKRFKRIKGNTVYYEFGQDDEYFIKLKGEYHEIKTKKDINRLMPDKKEFIDNYFNPALKKYNQDTFWSSFFNKLADTFISEKVREDL